MPLDTNVDTTSRMRIHTRFMLFVSGRFSLWAGAPQARAFRTNASMEDVLWVAETRLGIARRVRR